MKKGIGLFILLFVFHISFAQLSSNDLILSGTSTLNNQFSDGENFYTFFFNPTIGGMASDNIAAGGSTIIGIAGADGDIGYSVGLGGFFRLYFNSGSQNVLYSHIDASFSSQFNSTTFSTFNVGFGLASFLNRNVVLENQATFGAENSSATLAIYNIQLTSGLKIYLNRDAQVSSADLPTRKGSILIGGTTGMIRTDFRDEFSKTTFQLNPNLAFFLSDALATGARVNFTYADSGFGISITELLLMPLIRFYIPARNSPNSWFLTAGGGINYSRLNSETSENFNTTNNVIFFGGGLNLFISPTAAIELAPSYSLQLGDENSIGRIGLDIGFQYFLTKEE